MPLIAPQTTSKTETAAASAMHQSGNSTESELSSVEIKSTPDGAGITVDEKYKGSTPSVLRLSSGDHKIKLEKSGFKAWERTLTVTSGETTKVDATLEQQ